MIVLVLSDVDALTSLIIVSSLLCFPFVDLLILLIFWLLLIIWFFDLVSESVYVSFSVAFSAYVFLLFFVCLAFIGVFTFILFSSGCFFRVSNFRSLWRTFFPYLFDVVLGFFFLAFCFNVFTLLSIFYFFLSCCIPFLFGTSKFHFDVP